MSNRFDSTAPSDISLLLRADAEQRWLHREVIPVLRQIETREELPDEDIEAALAYLEATWGQAELRAQATDAAHGRMDGNQDEPLATRAHRYHAAVSVLRRIVAERVAPLLEPALDASSAQQGAISYASGRGEAACI